MLLKFICYTAPESYLKVFTVKLKAKRTIGYKSKSIVLFYAQHKYPLWDFSFHILIMHR